MKGSRSLPSNRLALFISSLLAGYCLSYTIFRSTNRIRFITRSFSLMKDSRRMNEEETIIAKTLVWKKIQEKEDSYILCSLDRNRFVDLAKLEESVCGKLRLVSKAQAEEVTQRKIGSISPFLLQDKGLTSSFRAIFDKDLIQSSKFITFSDDPTELDGRKYSAAELLQLFSPEVAPISRVESVEYTKQSNIPTAKGAIQDAPEPKRKGKANSKASPDEEILFSPNLLRKIAMSSDYTKMLQLVSSLLNQKFHPQYSFPATYSIADHINHPSKTSGKTALLLSCWKGSLPLVQLLLQNGADVNLFSINENNYGKTPIFYAITQCRDDIVQHLLLHSNPNLLIVNNKGQSPLSLAITHLQDETIQLLEEVEKKQMRENHFQWVDYYHSEHRGKGIFGDLDSRFINLHEYVLENQEYFEESKKGELLKQHLPVHETENSPSESQLKLKGAISEFLLVHQPVFENPNENVMQQKEKISDINNLILQKSEVRHIPLFPTTLETRRSIRTLYFMEQLQQKQSEIQHISSVSSPLIDLRVSDILASSKSFQSSQTQDRSLWKEIQNSEFINISKKNVVSLQGIIISKRQLSKQLAFLNISPKKSFLSVTNDGQLALTPLQLRYSWKDNDRKENESEKEKNYYSIQLIVGKALRMMIEEKEIEINLAKSESQQILSNSFEKLCKLLKTGQVIEIDGEIKAIHNRTDSILPSALIHFDNDVAPSSEIELLRNFHEVEIVVTSLKIIGVEIPSTVLNEHCLQSTNVHVPSSAPTTSPHYSTETAMQANESISLIKMINTSLSFPATEMKGNQKKAANITKEKTDHMMKPETCISFADITYFKQLPGTELPHSDISEAPVFFIDNNQLKSINYFNQVAQRIFEVATASHLPNNADVMENQIPMETIIGMDCEWQPGDLETREEEQTPNESEEKAKDKIDGYPVEILQISTIYGVFLFDIRNLFSFQHNNSEQSIINEENEINLLKANLVSLFENPNVWKIGFDLVQDVEKLCLSYNSAFVNVLQRKSLLGDEHYPNNPPIPLNGQKSISLHSFIDLKPLCASFLFNLPPSKYSSHPYFGLQRSSAFNSLSRMTFLFLKKHLNKEQQCSAWHLRPLSPPQLEYAALDGSILIELFQTLANEILKYNPYHTLPGFLKKHQRLTNFKYQIFSTSEMIEAFQEYYQYDFEKKKFLKRLPAFYKYLLNQVLLSLSWTSVDHEPLFPKLHWYHDNSKASRSPSHPDRQPQNSVDKNEYLMFSRRSRSISMDLSSYIGQFVGKSKEDCVRLIEQSVFYSPSPNFYSQQSMKKKNISSFNGFIQLNGSQILLFLNLFDDYLHDYDREHDNPHDKLQHPYATLKMNKKHQKILQRSSANNAAIFNFFWEEGKFFNFHVLQHQVDHFVPTTSSSCPPDASQDNIPPANPSSQAAAHCYHLFLRKETAKDFFYAGRCEIISSSQQNTKQEDHSFSSLEVAPVPIVKGPNFREFHLELMDYDKQRLSTNPVFSQMIANHSNFLAKEGISRSPLSGSSEK